MCKSTFFSSRCLDKNCIEYRKHNIDLFSLDIARIFSFGYFFRCIEKNFLQPFTFREKNRYNDSRGGEQAW